MKKTLVYFLIGFLILTLFSFFQITEVHAEDTNIPWTSSESWFYTGTVYMDNSAIDYGSATWMKTVPINADWFWYNEMDCGTGNSTCISKGVRSFSVGAKGANIKPDSYYKLIINMEYSGLGNWTIDTSSINSNNMCAIYTGSSWNYGTSVCDVSSVSVSSDGKTVTAYVHTKTGADGLLLEVGRPSNTSKDSILRVWQNRSFNSVAIRIKTYQILLTNDLSGQLSDISGQLGSISGSIAGTNQKLEDVNQGLDNINDNLTDSSIDDTSSKNFFNNFQDNDHGLSSVITAPLQFIKNLNNNTCTPISLTIPFVDKNFTLPCMSTIYSDNFGTFFTLYQTITTGFIAYYVSVRIFALVKGFKDPKDDRIEVMDL